MSDDTHAPVTYARYLQLEPVLSAQNARSGRHDEMLFIVIHQTTELWLKQILHELTASLAWLTDSDVEPALKALARVSRIQTLITQSWDILATLTPPDYLTFRDQLGSGSGFQSRQFRELEFILGLKNAAHLARFPAGGADRAALNARFVAPTLYDAALARVAAAGIPTPDDVLNRDVTARYKPHPGVERAWLAVYRNPHAYWDLYALAEKLVDLEDAFLQWRFRHVTTVERVIGRKRGTGGTSGVEYLLTGLEQRCFPELWSVRTAL